MRRIDLHASQQLPTIPKHVFAITKQHASHTAYGRKEPSQSYRTLRCKGSADRGCPICATQVAWQLRPGGVQMLHIKDLRNIFSPCNLFSHGKKNGLVFQLSPMSLSQIGTNRFANSSDFDSSTLSTQQGTKQGHTAMCPDLRRLVRNGVELI